MSEVNINENEKDLNELTAEVSNSVSTENILQEAFMLLKGNMLKAFVATFAYLTPLILVLFTPYVGFIIFAVLFGHLTVGYISYLKKLTTNKNPSILSIYANRKNVVTTIIMGVIYISLTLLGLTLFIVPGFIVMAYLGLVFNILEDDSFNGFISVFKKSTSIKTSKKIVFLSYKIMFTIGYLMAILLAIIANAYLMALFSTMPILAVALYLLAVFVLYSIALFLTMLLHSCNIIFYNSVQLTKQ